MSKKPEVKKVTRKKLSAAAKGKFAKKKTISKFVEVAKRSCRRHPDVSFPIGASCHKCQTACLRYSAMMVNKAFTLPCPTCMSATKEEDGGCIKTFYSKAGHFSCRHCKISYNLKGEKVSWASGKDEQLFNREILHRK